MKPKNKEDGYDCAEISRRSSSNDYDCVDYGDHSNLQANQDHHNSATIQNPYYEGADVESAIMKTRYSNEDLSPESGDRENVKVVENPYYVSSSVGHKS